MEAVISFHKLGHAFSRDGRDTDVLRDFDLQIAAGEFVAIVGPSGVGKSTLLRIVAGLIAPARGSVDVRTTANPKGLPVALVFQDARMLPWRRVLANVGFGLEHRGISPAERTERSRAALALVGLADYADRFPHELSGGQRQRVAIARALAVDPDILLMDEPFGALDAITREALQVELSRIHLATKKTVLFVTHSIDEAVFLADRVVAIAGQPGRVAAQIVIDAPRPRRRDDPALVAIKTRLRAALGAG